MEKSKEKSKKKIKVNPYLVGGVFLIGGILYLLSEPSAEEKAAGLEGLGSLRSRLKRIKEKITPKFVKKLEQKLPTPPVPKVLKKVAPVVTRLVNPMAASLPLRQNPADYYGQLYNHK